MHLENKVAVITGSASGIGLGIAQTFAKEGAKVVIADLDAKKAQETADKFNAQGYEAMAVTMDVTNEQQVEAGIAKVIAQFKQIDILVSNAGVQFISPVEELPFNEWKKLLSIHLDGAFLTTRACIKHMYQRGKGGSIIYMGSVHSKEASALKAPYVTAKHGLIGLCEVVAKEGAAHNVRANVICPGYVRTPLVEKQIPAQAKDLGISEQDVIKKVFLKDTIDGEFTTIEDVAQIALLFAAFDSNALSGQSLVVSHGWYMQ
jgi:3-hydroxybutyrate dehydrogenase